MKVKTNREKRMEYFKLKMKSLPRISFATTNSEPATRLSKIEDNNYSMVRYVDSGRVEITLRGREKIVLSSGDYFISPANVPYDYLVYEGSTVSMFSFYLDSGTTALVSQEEIYFEHSDNYVYVDIESLFIAITGKLSSTDRPYYALKQLIKEYDRIGEYVNACTSVRAVEFFLALAMNTLSAVKPSTGDAADERLCSYCDRIDEYIEKNYSQPITMTTISDLLMLHENYISRIYKRVRGITVMQRLLDVRIEKAKKLLVQNRYQVAEISKMVGFRSQRYFITTFKRIEHVTPGKYYDLQFNQRVFTYDPPDYIDPEDEEEY